MDVAQPYELICFGGIHGPRTYEFIVSRDDYFAHTGIHTLTLADLQFELQWHSGTRT
jgi:hypothetical protein